MKIGIPKEIKTLEARVGLIPAACAVLIEAGHEVYLQSTAGVLSGYADEEYARLGVRLLADAAQLYQTAEMIIKVKEPVAAEYTLLRAEHVLFSYLHLAAEEVLTDKLLSIGLTAVGFETVEENGLLPLLAPMSDIAGRLSIQVGTHLLHRPQGGKGLLLGGLPGADRGHVLIMGGGVAGGNAAILAAASGASVTIFDYDRQKQERLRAIGPNVTALYPFPERVAQAVAEADLIVGAVLVTGERAPHVISREMLKTMAAGGVVVDISVDQGGCIETTRPTSYADPTYIEEEIVHFAVTNMPGAVPRSASQALSASVLPYAQKLAESDWRKHAALVRGINVEKGNLVHPALKHTFPDK